MCNFGIVIIYNLFLSTPSARRATGSGSSARAGNGDFYPRPPRGGRPDFFFQRLPAFGFLSTPSARRATWMLPAHRSESKISIHALREEGDLAAKLAALEKQISIHALREEGDRIPCDPVPRERISIHALREEGDLGELLHSAGRHVISIHALREEGDTTPRTSAASCNKFLSTPSARRATAKTETKSLFSNKLYNILHEFRRALIYNGSKNYPNHAKRLKNPVRRCRKDAEDSPFAPGRKTQNNSRPSCSKGG